MALLCHPISYEKVCLIFHNFVKYYSLLYPCGTGIIFTRWQLFTRERPHKKRFHIDQGEFIMKLKTITVAAAALALAVGMTACGSSASSTAASSTAASSVASSAASSEAASSAASSEAAAEPAEYTVYNTTGENVTELYLYAVGAESKGENLAGENGLADGENVVLTLPEDADQSAKYVLEFTTEDGTTQSFETLGYEVAPISLLSVDAAAGATPIAFSAPQQ